MASHPVTVYRWDDPGAPQLPNGKPSEIIDILTKCLVDGYGDKTSLGWTRPFYDATNQAVAFRNSVADGGSGGYVRFASSNGTDNNNVMMTVSSAGSMTDINTSVNQGNIQGFTISSGSGANKLDRWMLIGTPTAFYFVTARNTQNHSVGFIYIPLGFCGDIHAVIPNDAGRFIAVFNTATANGTAASYTDSMNYLTVTISTSASAILKMYDSDNAGLSTNYGFASLNSAQAQQNDARFNGAPTYPNHRLPVPVNRPSMSPDNITASNSDRLGVEPMNSTLRPYHRGFLPGMFTTLYPGYRALTWPGNVILDGISHLPLVNTNSAAVAIFINLEQWDDPYTL